jgi:hypothetical protein
MMSAHSLQEHRHMFNSRTWRGYLSDVLLLLGSDGLLYNRRECGAGWIAGQAPHLLLPLPLPLLLLLLPLTCLGSR